MPVRVLIADDQALVRTGVRMVLSAAGGIEVVAEAGGGLEAIAAARRFEPDVVLMDIRMPGLDGIEATRRLAADGMRVVILTTYDLDEYVFDALGAGACGFLLKHGPADELIRGVRAAAAGDALLAPSVTRRLIGEFARRPRGRTPVDGQTSLTQREQEVWRLLAEGMSNAEIGATLRVGEATVKTHVAHLLAKLGVRDRMQAVILAYERGVVQPPAR